MDTCYRFKGKDYISETSAIDAWTIDPDRNYFDVFKVRGDKVIYSLRLCEITFDKLNELMSSYNDVWVYYKKSNKGYKYKSANNLKLESIDNIQIKELRGMNGNIQDAMRVVYVNKCIVVIR